MRIAISIISAGLLVASPCYAATKRGKPARPTVTEAMIARDLVFGCAAFVPGAIDYLVHSAHWSADGAKRDKVGYWIGLSARIYLQYKRSGETNYTPFYESSKNLADWAQDGGDTRFARLTACVNGRIDAHLKGMPFLMQLPR